MILTELDGLCHGEFLRAESSSFIHVGQDFGLEHWQ